MCLVSQKTWILLKVLYMPSSSLEPLEGLVISLKSSSAANLPTQRLHRSLVAVESCVLFCTLREREIKDVSHEEAKGAARQWCVVLFSQVRSIHGWCITGREGSTNSWRKTEDEDRKKWILMRLWIQIRINTSLYGNAIIWLPQFFVIWAGTKRLRSTVGSKETAGPCGDVSFCQ